MRAREFISETKSAKISKRNSQSTRGLNKFRDPDGYDRTYDLNRVMMAAACTDGDSEPWIDQESWAGKYNTAHPYTEVEQRMLKKAYAAAGIEYDDLNGVDLNSRELDSVNTKSAVPTTKRPDFR
jgi:hypothetical protein